MCGRFTITQPAVVIAALPCLVMDKLPTPRYNVAPGQQAPMVRLKNGRMELVQATWGLAPRFADADARLLINARSQSVHQKPTFAPLFVGRRCVIPADGFYEWPQNGRQGAEAHYFKFRGNDCCGFAGIWDGENSGVKPDGIRFVILTTSALAPVCEIHDRMPVILRRDRIMDYLSEPAEAEIHSPGSQEEVASAGTRAHARLMAMISAWDSDLLESIPVGRAVNRVSNDSPECIRLRPPKEGLFN